MSLISCPGTVSTAPLRVSVCHRWHRKYFVTVLAGLFRKRAATGANVCEQHSITICHKTSCEFWPWRLISTSWTRPLRQTKNTDCICGRRTPRKELSKRCPDTKLEAFRTLANSIISSKIVPAKTYSYWPNPSSLITKQNTIPPLYHKKEMSCDISFDFLHILWIHIYD